MGQEDRGGDAIICFIIYRNQLRRHLPFWCVFRRAHTRTGNDQWSDGAENRMDKWGGTEKKSIFIYFYCPVSLVLTYGPAHVVWT